MMSSTFAEDILNDRDNGAFEGHFRQLGPRLLIFDRPSPGGLSFYGQHTNLVRLDIYRLQSRKFVSSADNPIRLAWRILPCPVTDTGFYFGHPYLPPVDLSRFFSAGTIGHRAAIVTDGNEHLNEHDRAAPMFRSADWRSDPWQGRDRMQASGALKQITPGDMYAEPYAEHPIQPSHADS